MPSAVAPLLADVEIRRSDRARRLTLRVDPRSGGAIVTAPVSCPDRMIAEFLVRQEGWLKRQRAALAPSIQFLPGAVVPVRGTTLEIVHDRGRGVPVRRTGGLLIVRGEEGHVPRRVQDWLMTEAKQDLAARAHAHAEALGATVRRVSVRDTTSRWGSCSSKGTLSFSWRLILAPSDVLDYVAAHEAAHLREMNHSPRFWALVESRVPDWRAQRHWLKVEGPSLHRYGQ